MITPLHSFALPQVIAVFHTQSPCAKNRCESLPLFSTIIFPLTICRAWLQFLLSDWTMYNPQFLDNDQSRFIRRDAPSAPIDIYSWSTGMHASDWAFSTEHIAYCPPTTSPELFKISAASSRDERHPITWSHPPPPSAIPPPLPLSYTPFSSHSFTSPPNCTTGRTSNLSTPHFQPHGAYYVNSLLTEWNGYAV